MYNFDEIIDRRNTNALNTDGFRGYIFHAGPEKVFPFKDEEFVRMWVADMEFACAPAICDAIKARVDKRIFGYTMMFDDAYYNAFNGWCQKRYGWSFKKEELCFSPGIIPALYQIVEDLIGEGETFVITTPSYGYFLHAAEYNDVPIVCSDLILSEEGWKIDFEDLERKCADPKVKMLLWCNPHNPTGRIWTEEELKKVAAIVEKYDLWLVSDEIHCDLIREGLCHIPFGKILPDYDKLITCMSASKTFNMAGLMFSDIIIRNQAERERFNSRDKIAGMLNPLSIAAHQAAYEHGAEWLDELKVYLDGNFRYLDPEDPSPRGALLDPGGDVPRVGRSLQVPAGRRGSPRLLRQRGGRPPRGRQLPLRRQRRGLCPSEPRHAAQHHRNRHGAHRGFH